PLGLVRPKLIAEQQRTSTNLGFTNFILFLV
ncbi:hypothetical protein LCGC14_2805430, partial [marine sediment metagenome]